LTREQLATRLAAVEGEFALLSDRQEVQLDQLRQQNEDIRLLREQHGSALVQLEALRARRDELTRELDRTRGALDGERTRRAEIEASLGALTLKLKAAERVVEEARVRVDEFKTRLSSALENAKASPARPAPKPKDAAKPKDAPSAP
jgi:chromosome segregation ATPase